MKTINEIFINMLTIEQLETSMKELETIAKQKYYNIQCYYEKNILDEDTPHAEEFEELMSHTKWENFLPLEYKILKEKLDEQKAKAA